jgi:hypothetical protein
MCVYGNSCWIDVGGAWIDIELYYVEGRKELIRLEIKIY